MLSLPELLQQGTSHAWLFVPSAILLGALHGLEPGHSKTMMAAFIIAIRGTVTQAILLGLAATASHTLVVWAVALIGMRLGGAWNAETTEPYFQLVSAVLIIGIAVWMLWRTWREQRRAKLEHHDHNHAHHHGEETRRTDTGHGVLALEVFEDGVPPRWRIRAQSGHGWPAGAVAVETERPDGKRQVFSFADRGDYLESVEEIPEPHEFMARLRLSHGDHAHSYDVAFTEHDHGQDHGHDHMHEELRGLDVSTGGHQDAHELAHANDIRRRFADRNVTTWQIVMFGLTGGLIPCPAAITVLLLCLQLKQFTLGIALVLCFSIGLAITMVTAGVIAALSVRHVSRRWSGFAALAQRAPYASGALIICVGLYVGWQGWSALAAAGAIS
ncbi:nickel/cobalt exporter [Rhizobiales bacterium GAS113]|nr:nickel/cobalt exporter [Rhizobiales bacterium GAS113]